MKKREVIELTENEQSFTHYTIVNNGVDSEIPASVFEVSLWNEVVALRCALKSIREKILEAKSGKGSMAYYIDYILAIIRRCGVDGFSKDRKD